MNLGEVHRTYLDDLVVHRLEEVTQWLDDTLRNHVPDLRRLGQSTRRCVRNCPACLLLGLEVGVLENVDKGRNDIAKQRSALNSCCPKALTYASITAWI